MKANQIESFVNESEGTEVRVFEIEKGYSVTLKDLDSGIVFPSATIFPHTMTDARNKAIKKAKKIAGV